MTYTTLNKLMAAAFIGKGYRQPIINALNDDNHIFCCVDGIQFTITQHNNRSFELEYTYV